MPAPRRESVLNGLRSPPRLPAPLRSAARAGTGGAAARTALVVEGRGMRGVFAAGVLDAFAAHRFAPFDLAIGTSADAAALASHLAGQAGRNRRCLTGLMRRPEFVDPWRGPWRALRRGHWTDLDWLFAACAREDPLDVAALLGSGIEFLVAATYADTGAPVYLAPRADDAVEVLKASSALPLLYRGPVVVRGRRLVDGGIAAAIPAAEAYRRGARRILVVRSRASGVGRRPGLEHCAGALAVRGYPALARAIWESPTRYRAALAFIAHPSADCWVQEVALPGPLATGRTTQTLAALERDYAQVRPPGATAPPHGSPGGFHRPAERRREVAHFRCADTRQTSSLRVSRSADALAGAAAYRNACAHAVCTQLRAQPGGPHAT